MLEGGLDALQILLDPSRMGWLALGTFVGLCIGVLPGLGGTVGMSILLPFVYGMDPFNGVALLIGMAAVTHTSDTFPSVLLGVPGSAGSQATIMDGYPLAQQGQAARALGAAFSASLVGGLIGAVTLFFVLGMARPLVLLLGSPELFMLALLGLSMVGVLSKGSALSGTLAGFLGLLLGSVGAAPATPEYRFTFGALYLYDGIPLAVLALGLFALPEMIDLLLSRSKISERAALSGSLWGGVREAFQHRWLMLRSAMMGCALGMVPGVGGSVVDWITYGIAAQTSRTDNRFGEGDIRGVIAPESANNAKEGGTLVPTLLFGIPGSGTTAVLLGGMMLLGLQPGPTMLTTNLDITLATVWTLSIANVLAVIACLALAPAVARLSLIRGQVLVPLLLVIMVMAAYQSSRGWGDIVTFFAIGAVGWIMKRLDWPRAPMLIGFVLALPAERYLHISISRYGADWLMRPSVLVIGALIAAVMAFGFKKGPSAAPVQVETQR